MKYVWVYLVLFAINVLIALAVYTWVPEYRPHFLMEDRLVENLTAFFYVGAFILALVFVFRSKEHQRALIVISAVALLGFLDEMSFGQRLFGLNMPHIHGIRIDAAHDFFFLGYISIRKYVLPHTTLVYSLIGIGAISAVMVTLKCRSKIIGTFTGSHHKEAYILASIFVCLGLFALVLDLDIVPYRITPLLEEIFEMNAAIALIFCSLSLLQFCHPSEGI